MSVGDFNWRHAKCPVCDAGPKAYHFEADERDNCPALTGRTDVTTFFCGYVSVNNGNTSGNIANTSPCSRAQASALRYRDMISAFKSEKEDRMKSYLELAAYLSAPLLSATGRVTRLDLDKEFFRLGPSGATGILISYASCPSLGNTSNDLRDPLKTIMRDDIECEVFYIKRPHPRPEENIQFDLKLIRPVVGPRDDF